MGNKTGFLVSFLLVASVAAQEEEKPTFDDLRSSLKKVDDRNEKEKSSERNEKIRRNHSETLAIYERVLRRRNGDLDNVATRLKVNHGLEAKYGKLLETAGAEIALLRSTWINRTLSLKKSLDEGKISPAAYSRLIEADGQKYRNREAELKDDLVFYTEELTIARKRIKEFELKKELLEFDPFEPQKLDVAKKKNEPISGIAERVRSRVRTIAHYRDLSVVDTLK